MPECGKQWECCPCTVCTEWALPLNLTEVAPLLGISLYLQESQDIDAVPWGQGYTCYLMPGPSRNESPSEAEVVVSEVLPPQDP